MTKQTKTMEFVLGILVGLTLYLYLEHNNINLGADQPDTSTNSKVLPSIQIPYHHSVSSGVNKTYPIIKGIKPLEKPQVVPTTTIEIELAPSRRVEDPSLSPPIFL